MTTGTRSRFNRSAVIQVKSIGGRNTRRPYLDIWPRFRTVKHTDDGEYVLLPLDTWSRISFRNLGVSIDWWVIAEVNGIIDPWKELAQKKEEGTTLRMPSVVRTNFDFLTFGRGRTYR